jgi:hypothetical protein
MPKQNYKPLQLADATSSDGGAHSISVSSSWVVHFCISPLNSNEFDQPGNLQAKYFRPSCRFPRVKTGVLSATLIVSSSLCFQIHLFFQAHHSKDLNSIKNLFLNSASKFFFEGTVIEFKDYGFVYLPITKAFLLSMDLNAASIHWVRTIFMEATNPNMSVTAESEGQATELEEPVLDKPDVVGNLSEILVAMLTRCRSAYQSDSLVTSKHDMLVASLFFGGIQPYKPNCSDSVRWMPIALLDLRDFVYSVLGSYYLLVWSPMTLLATVPILFLSVLKRWLSMHAKWMEKKANQRIVSDLNSDSLRNNADQRDNRLSLARVGRACYRLNFIDNCRPLTLYLTCMHYVAYSKRKYFFYLPEDMLIWIAYFNGLRLIMGGQATLLIGVALGVVSFLLRHYLQSSPVTSPTCDQLSRFLVSLLYAVCYGTKDLIALHYTLSFAPDYLDALNGTLSNQTRLALLNASDPWSDWSYNQTLDLPVIDGWSEQQRFIFLTGLIFFDLSYYTLMNARSPKRDNPPGSKQLGFTGLVDSLGVVSLLFFIPWDVFFMGMQAAEMLFALQVFTQMLYKLAIVSSSFELMLTLSVVPIVAMISGLVFAAMNVAYGCQLCCKTAEPWMRRADKLLTNRSDVKHSVIEINHIMLRGNKPVGDELEAWISFLDTSENVGDKVKLFLQTMATKAETWKTFQKVVSRYFPLLDFRNESNKAVSWNKFYLAALKFTPANHSDKKANSSDKPSANSIFTPRRRLSSEGSCDHLGQQFVTPSRPARDPCESSPAMA